MAKCNDCDRTIAGHKWGKVKAPGWFFSKDGTAYCPEHVPGWVALASRTMKEPDCGGCKGQGAHSRRCRTNPGWFWYRLQDMAEDLADTIGSNDVTSANMAYAIAARMKSRAEEKEEDAPYGK